MGCEVNSAAEDMLDASVNVGSPHLQEALIEVFGVAILQLRHAIDTEIDQILRDAFTHAGNGKQAAVSRTFSSPGSAKLQPIQKWGL